MWWGWPGVTAVRGGGGLGSQGGDDGDSWRHLSPSHVVIVDMLRWHLPYASCRRRLRRSGVDALLSLLSSSSSFMWPCLRCGRWSSSSLSRLGICHAHRCLRRTGMDALPSSSSLSSSRHGICHGRLDIAVLACTHCCRRLPALAFAMKGRWRDAEFAAPVVRVVSQSSSC